MTRRLLLFALCSIFGATASNAGAQARDNAATPWGTVRVPGGFSALLHAARIGGPAEDWRTIPVVIEMAFAGPEGLRITRSINAYAALLRNLHRQITSVSSDRTVSVSARAKRLREFDELLDTLGLEYDTATGSVRVTPGPPRDAHLREAAAVGKGD